MADTYTPNYNLTKPSIGGDPDTWGTLLNGNFDIIDSGMAALVKLDGSRPMSGPLRLPNSAPIYFERTDGNYHAVMQLTNDSPNNHTDIINCDGGGRIRFINDGYSAVLGSFDNAGNFGAAGDITASSDRRLKSNIKRIKGAMEKVRELVGVTFTRRRSEDKTRHMGFIAQDLEPIVPEVVRTDEEGMKSIAYANLTALLAEALKELDARVAALEAGE